MSACEKLPSMYGISGWTLEYGVRDLLGDYLSPFGDLSFSRFADVEADTIAQLAALLPPANLEDRQNCAPTMSELIGAALRRPQQVTLSGYLVGPPRHDERVSVDGLTVTGTPICAGGGWGVEPQVEERLRVWLALGDYLGCEASAENCPDEIIPIADRNTGDSGSVPMTQGWWVWWD